jgi:hypothetical protein
LAAEPPLRGAALPPTMATVDFCGYTWSVEDGGAYSNQNVWLDTSGYMHLKVRNDSGNWTCAKVTSTSNIGSGILQWQIIGNHDTLDKNVVLSLYGDRGIDGQDEIDIQFSKFGADSGNNGMFTVYPNVPGYSKVTNAFTYSLSGTESTARYKWSSTRIIFLLMNGFQSITSTSGLITQWSYLPSLPSRYIPQESMPVIMSLDLHNGAPPSDSQEVEMVIKNFTKG